MNSDIAILILVIISAIIGSFGALFLKMGANKIKLKFRLKDIIGLLYNYKLILGLFFYGLSTIILIMALRLGELALVYPLTSIAYILIALLSVQFLKEKMNLYKWLGILFIVIGVVLIKL